MMTLLCTDLSDHANRGTASINEHINTFCLYGAWNELPALFEKNRIYFPLFALQRKNHDGHNEEIQVLSRFSFLNRIK